MRPHSDFHAPDRPVVTRMKAPIPEMRLNLPPYEWKEFPKMALKYATDADVEFFRNMYENFDDRIGKARYTQKVPKKGALIAMRDDVGQIIVFDDADEEEAFYNEHPDIERVITAPGQSTPQVNEDELAEFRAWKAAQQNKDSAIKNPLLGGPEEGLRARAAELGIEIDNRWGTARLRKEIAAKEAEIAAENG